MYSVDPRTHRWKQTKTFASREANLVLLDKYWLPLSDNPITTPQKLNRSATRCIRRYYFQARIWNCQIPCHAVDSQLFTSLSYGSRNTVAQPPRWFCPAIGHMCGRSVQKKKKIGTRSGTQIGTRRGQLLFMRLWVLLYSLYSISF
jgi:hypothetical protein